MAFYSHGGQFKKRYSFFWGKTLRVASGKGASEHQFGTTRYNSVQVIPAGTQLSTRGERRAIKRVTRPPNELTKEFATSLLFDFPIKPVRADPFLLLLFPAHCCYFCFSYPLRIVEVLLHFPLSGSPLVRTQHAGLPTAIPALSVWLLPWTLSC